FVGDEAGGRDRRGGGGRRRRRGISERDVIGRAVRGERHDRRGFGKRRGRSGEGRGDADSEFRDHGLSGRTSNRQSAPFSGAFMAPSMHGGRAPRGLTLSLLPARPAPTPER